MPIRGVRRRALLQAGALTAGTWLLPCAADAAAVPLVDPYIGAIPFVFPLAAGAYQTPFGDNWHGLREGSLYPWNHRGSTAIRAHDGVDVYPQDPSALPLVYAPLAGTVAAVCRRSANTVDATVDYQVSATTPPPWDYHQAIDDVANLPLYGNCLWLRSADPASAGYFVFFCHLQNEQVLQGLRPDQPVTTAMPVGRMGDTGNAQGTPQLHVEVHYPIGQRFTCAMCSPNKVGLTAIDSYASLLLATPRAAAPAAPVAAMELRGSASGALTADPGGAYAYYQMSAPTGAPVTVQLSYAPFDAVFAHGVGVNVYQGGQRLASATGQATGIGDTTNRSGALVTVTPSASAGPLVVQIFNYGRLPITYTVQET